MKANIKNITYVEVDGKFDIVVEFSNLPIDTFETEQKAKDFIAGYLYEAIDNGYHLKGEVFRNFVEIDLMGGVEYKKLRDIDVLMEVV